MTIYNFDDHPNQKFSIDYNGEKIDMRLIYNPLNNGWYMSIPGVVEGQKVTLGVPIFLGYGYELIYFVGVMFGKDWTDGDITRIRMIVLTDDEAQDLENISVLETIMGISVTGAESNEIH
jgi:hypothetical protein